MANYNILFVIVIVLYYFGYGTTSPSVKKPNQRNEARNRDEPVDNKINTLTTLAPPPACFIRHELSAFAGAWPIKVTKKNNSPQDCADSCLKIHDDQEEAHSCKAYDYNTRTGLCRFYDKNTKDEKSTIRIVDSVKLNVYELDEQCWRRHNSPPTPPPHQSACAHGFKPMMERVTGWYLKTTGLAFKQVTEKDCIKHCLKDELPDQGENYKCSSVSYISDNQACVYLNQIARPLNKNGPPLTPDTRYNYYSKLCLPTDAVAKCPGYITRFVGKQLVAMSDAKITTPTYALCVKECLTAQTKLGFVCKSGMFYNKQSTDNCILNYSDHYSEHTLFIDEPAQEIDYFSVQSCHW